MSDFSNKCRESLKDTGENVYQLSASSGLDRTSLQRMITGKRLPGIDFVRQFCDSLRINPSQRRELMELYKIEKIGKEIYYNRKYIQELLGVISSQQVISREGFLRLPSFPFYRGTFSLDVEKKVLSLFEDILSSGSSETIRTNLPANCRLLVQIFSHLYPKYEKLPPVIQILPLHQNPSASPDYNMNLETFSAHSFRSCQVLWATSHIITILRQAESFPAMNCFLFSYSLKKSCCCYPRI